MTLETTIYMTNIVIGVILAGLLTHGWLKQPHQHSLGWWMFAAWTMVVADIFFVFRPDLPHWVGRLAPTLLVTLGHGGLYLAARHTARLSLNWGVVLGGVLIHALALVYFLTLDQPTHWRMVTNGAVWTGFSIASFLALRQAPTWYWAPLFAPANAFLLHVAFHLFRIALAFASASNHWQSVREMLQIVGDMEVSFFMVMLFVGILLAALQHRHAELMSARAEVETLTGLLPICAWCKKVRDDDGYWQQVEDYFAQRGNIRFTHGICADCMSDQEKTAATDRSS